MKRSFVSAAVLAAALSLASASVGAAGEQYVDAAGYAVSGYDVVAYHGLAQAPVGQAQPAPVLGSTAFTAEHNGAVWAFASAENREKFLADPAKYAPAYDGHCAYGVAKGGKVPANPALWRIVDGRLYLNITETVAGFWNEDISGNLRLSEGNWPGLEPKPASNAAIPAFSGSGPKS